MKQFVLGDARNDFISDINTSMLLEGYPFQMFAVSTLAEVISTAQSHPQAVVILGETMLQDADLGPIQNQKYGYAVTPQGAATIAAAGLASIGICHTSEELLTSLCNDPLQTVGSAPAQPVAPTQPAPVKATTQPVSPPQTQTQEPQAVPQTAAPTQTPQQPVPQMPNGMPGMTPEMMQMMMSMFSQMQSAQGGAPVDERAQSHVSPVAGAANAAPPSVETVGTQMKNRKQARQNIETDADIDNDLLSSAIGTKQKTKVITVYAAKGGVGKTTISTETAVYLALTSNGRRKFRVCIVDYNIDFGDVSTTLELDDAGPNMSYWASEIRELMERGQKPEDINFTRQQMEDLYLQKMQDTGLYVLCAPITHEDSMSIKTDELKTMLRNLVEHGEFDFIICDTGNNTRDSSITAIEQSDCVLLVATQDVTTANCNASVLRTLENAGIATDKVRLVINNIMSYRETGISVQEVEETFPNYQCVARIKRTPDIIRANNQSRPLVYKPNHEYTKQIQRIVHFITAGEVRDEPVKKGFFGFGRRG